jgi:ribose-phosphate pyrophosphokinase
VTVRLVPGSASREFAAVLAAAIEVDLVKVELDRFPDGERRPRITEVLDGEDAYIVQATGPPVAEHLIEALLLADACRRAGCRQVIAVMPYFGYARQDTRTRTGEAIGARVVCDALRASGVDRLVVVEPHTPALEAIAGIPVEAISAVDVLARELVECRTAEHVVVAPDLGAAGLARRYASRLDLPVAVVHKTRLSSTEVEAKGVVGDVRDRRPLIVDDMISTGATIEAAFEALVAHGAQRHLTVAATHGLFVGPSRERLAWLPLERLLVTDTVTPRPTGDLPIEVHPLAPVVGHVIDGRRQGPRRGVERGPRLSANP